MTGKTHLLVGACTGVVAATCVASNSPLIFGLTITATCIGSIIPDIDNEKSIIGNKIKIFSTIINKISGHRGITHAPLLLLAFYVLIFFLLNLNGLGSYIPVLQGYAIGYASHLCLDILTKGGIPLLYPFSKKRMHILQIKSGGIAEFLIVCSLISILILVAFLMLCK